MYGVYTFLLQMPFIIHTKSKLTKKFWKPLCFFFLKFFNYQIRLSMITVTDYQLVNNAECYLRDPLQMQTVKGPNYSFEVRYSSCSW